MMLEFALSLPSPFDSLPNEIVHEVLEYLDSKDLKNASLVDKRFHTLIAKSQKIMRKLPLTVSAIKKSEFHDIDDFHRRYSKINFKDMPPSFWYNYLKNGLKKIGKDVTQVNFRVSRFPINGFVEALSCFPNVENVNLSCAQSPAFEYQLIDPENNQKIKFLHMEYVRSVYNEHL